MLSRGADIPVCQADRRRTGMSAPLFLASPAQHSACARCSTCGTQPYLEVFNNHPGKVEPGEFALLPMPPGPKTFTSMSLSATISSRREHAVAH